MLFVHRQQNCLVLYELASLNVVWQYLPRRLHDGVTKRRTNFDYGSFFAAGGVTCQGPCPKLATQDRPNLWRQHFTEYTIRGHILLELQRMCVGRGSKHCSSRRKLDSSAYFVVCTAVMDTAQLRHEQFQPQTTIKTLAWKQNLCSRWPSGALLFDGDAHALGFRFNRFQ